MELDGPYMEIDNILVVVCVALKLCLMVMDMSSIWQIVRNLTDLRLMDILVILESLSCLSVKTTN